MVRPRGLLLLLSLLAAPAGGQTLVTSPGPDRVAVTVYRDPLRDAGQPFNLNWLNGFALISETRRVSIPAGEAEIRFEGVAAGILPQSAIVAGFPDGIVERNRDALLLSPGSLLDRSLGRRVHLRRTSLATGAVREHEAVIRSSADGAVVLQTPDGFEALRCTGLPETLRYDEVPADLSARPTLSVRVRSSAPLTAAVTLSYLATNFDWQANYVATLSADGDRVDLFAWLTLASNDDTSFVAADTQAVAGRLNREDVQVEPPEARALTLQCWPQGRTHQIPSDRSRGRAPPPAPNFSTSPVTVVNSEEVRLTGTVAVADLIARQEDLGDVKLYRIPEPVTVAANSQKQVAFLAREDVTAAIVYRQRLDPGDADDPRPVRRVLVTRNRAAEGLGIPLPAGRVVLFAAAADRPILIGEGWLEDRAVGDDVDIELAEAEGVASRIEAAEDGDGRTDYVLTVTNDRPVPVRYEAEFDARRRAGFRPRQRLERRDGRPLWVVTVPANGSATLRYRVRERDK